MTLILNVGLDVSKDTINYAIPQKQGFKNGKITNSLKGFELLEKQLYQRAGNYEETRIIAETTGIYSFPVMDYFSTRGWHCNEVHAYSIAKYKQTVLQRNKTDKVDAKEISNYAMRYSDKLDKPYIARTPELIELGMLLRMTEQLEKKRRALGNIQEAYGFLNDDRVEGFDFTMAGKGLAALLESDTAYIKSFNKGVNTYLSTHFEDTTTALRSIKGLGDKTLPYCIYYTHDFKRFNTSREFTSYIGVVPNFYESGTSVRSKSRIAHKTLCNNTLRSKLTQAANIAMRHNKQVKQLVERLTHLTWKQQLIAATRKLAVQIHYCGTTKNLYSEAA